MIKEPEKPDAKKDNGELIGEIGRDIYTTDVGDFDTDHDLGDWNEDFDVNEL